MDAKDIVATWLKDNWYDGLYTDDCGCEISELMPCGEFGVMCEPGYKVPCSGPESCPADGDCPWHISGKKP